MTRSVEIAKAMAVAGFDWLFLDMEHGVMSLEACAQISTAALDAGIAPIARVPNGEYSIATRALDNGALGIVMPHVDTAAEAREVVNRLKYPPVGHRSMGGIGPHYSLRSANSGEAASALNAANLTVVMLSRWARVSSCPARTQRLWRPVRRSAPGFCGSFPRDSEQHCRSVAARLNRCNLRFAGYAPIRWSVSHR